MGLPVILCGKTEQIGAGVIEMLKPEYEVIHFVMTPEGGREQIRAIFEGSRSPPRDSELGSKDYSRRPAAVILGGAFTDEAAGIMMREARDVHPVPWLRVDASKPAPPLGPEYGKALVARIKKLIPQLERDGKMSQADVFWY